MWCSQRPRKRLGHKEYTYVKFLCKEAKLHFVFFSFFWKLWDVKCSHSHEESSIQTYLIMFWAKNIFFVLCISWYETMWQCRKKNIYRPQVCVHWVHTAVSSTDNTHHLLYVFEKPHWCSGAVPLTSSRSLTASVLPQRAASCRAVPALVCLLMSMPAWIRSLETQEVRD